ncbi:hypothetical protein LAZ67_21001629 [Cordylochernes scorpioides]|uniref:Uncharacterized protein n=1 Tax=Cordylochernes scorpioides TaxID=51811 RepID=A0ABY6LRE4_9ARAC|nr:hypothetical protein LAZ67_21001629 [Cordylochernes scorpioides]
MMTDRTKSATMFNVPPWEISEVGYIVLVWTMDKHRFEDRVRVANVWREKKKRTVSLDADCSSANKKGRSLRLKGISPDLGLLDKETNHDKRMNLEKSHPKCLQLTCPCNSQDALPHLLEMEVKTPKNG